MSDVDWYTEKDIKKEGYARILFTGARKIGKSSAILSTAPTPIAVLNCDGRDAQAPAVRHGAHSLKIADVTSSRVWKSSVEDAIAMAERGEVKTIVVDTLSMLINHVLTLEYTRKYIGEKDKFGIWRDVADDGMRMIGKLLNAPAHLFLIVHVDQAGGGLVLNGNVIKEQLPALVSDIVHMDFVEKESALEDGEVRVFRIGPSASGVSGGRSPLLDSENLTIPANVKALFRQFGFNTQEEKEQE